MTPNYKNDNCPGFCSRGETLLKGGVVLLVVILSTLSLQAAELEDARLDTSRSLANSLQRELGTRRKSALTSEGPVAAISVCHLEAGTIAEGVSNKTSAEVGRTALRVRNPANEADADARNILEMFQQQIADGESGPLENFAIAQDGSARYMRSIVTQPVCLACHGSELSAEVKAAVTESYPLDQATGFVAGELRGAFIVNWPVAPLP
jgi:hypothetical protein